MAAPAPWAQVTRAHSTPKVGVVRPAQPPVPSQRRQRYDSAVFAFRRQGTDKLFGNFLDHLVGDIVAGCLTADSHTPGNAVEVI